MRSGCTTCNSYANTSGGDRRDDGQNYAMTANYIDVWVLKANVPGADPLAVENH